MYSSVMSPFSHDFIKMEKDQLKYQQCLNWVISTIFTHRVWFLDGRVSIQVTIVYLLATCIKDIKRRLSFKKTFSIHASNG